MKFSNLKTKIRLCTFVSVSALLLGSCNDEKSVNNSTSGDNEVDTTVAVNSPVVKKSKKSGKVSTANNVDDSKMKMEKDKMGYYNRTEVLPAFSGGQSAMENYIVNTIEYPQDAIDNNVEGIVTVQFGVDESGNISNVSAVGNKIGYGLEEEAIRVISKMPKWTPGQVKGKNVKTWRTLPINYRLEES